MVGGLCESQSGGACSVITDERAEKAIAYLATSDEKAAVAKVDVQRLEDEIKAQKAAIFMRLTGSVEQRKAEAETHETVAATRKEYYSALLSYEHIANKRRTESLVCELWRSVTSNRRAGLVQ